MPTKVRLALAVLLFLCMAAGAGGAAAIDLHELLDGLRKGAPRLSAGPGIFDGFIVAGGLALLAGLMIDGDLVRRAPTKASLTATKWVLAATVTWLLVGPVLGEAFLVNQLHQAGYVPCGVLRPPARFARTQWVLPDQPCTPQADPWCFARRRARFAFPTGRGGLGMLLAGHGGKLYSP